MAGYSTADGTMMTTEKVKSPSLSNCEFSDDFKDFLTTIRLCIEATQQRGCWFNNFTHPLMQIASSPRWVVPMHGKQGLLLLLLLLLLL